MVCVEVPLEGERVMVLSFIHPMARLSPQRREVGRLLVVMPTWVGDCVMATPTLRALRQLYLQSQVTALVRDNVRPIMEGCPWVDRTITLRRGGRSNRNRSPGPIRLARKLKTRRFDMAVLLPNSFRTALLARMAGIKRRVGYDRDGRGFLLTDRLLPRRGREGFVPVSARDYYLGIARYLGAVEPDATMQLFTRAEHDAKAVKILEAAGHREGSGKPLVVVNPGANYGDAKMWAPERFAEVADRFVREFGADVAVTGAPNERAILDAVLMAAKERIIDLPGLGVDLTLLKSVIRCSNLMITNDTGPRHMAAALGVPVVTVFGPTDPAWTENHIPTERQVMVKVFCGPCQKKTCPLDHRCMTRIQPEMVFEKAVELLNSAARLTVLPMPLPQSQLHSNL